MSELKVIDLGDIREAIVNNQSVYYEYYAKSEANKVIRHQKYKRCLAMERWCNERYILGDCVYELGKTRFYERWKKRWLELANNFNPTNLQT